MKQTVCLQCGKPLTRGQIKYCSRRCAWLVARQMSHSKKAKESRKRRLKLRKEARKR